jgi:hypothetical protein
MSGSASTRTWWLSGNGATSGLVLGTGSCWGFLFETDAHGLGLGGPVHVEATLHNEADGNSLIEMLGGAASLLDQLGAAGSILQPRMFDVWKDEVMQRRALLKLMGLATTAGLVPALEREPTRQGKLTQSEEPSGPEA